MSYVYHGSKTQGLTKLIPHKSTHGIYVYASKSKAIAVIMSKKCGDDATYSLTTSSDGKLDLVERIPHAFDKMFSNEFSLYTLDSSFFHDINTGFNEVVSEYEVPIICEETYGCLMNAINKLVEDELVHIYYYPNRPDYIPVDDYDLIDKIRNLYIDLFGKVIEQNSQNMISLIQEYKSGDDNDVYINSTYRNNSRYAYNYNF